MQLMDELPMVWGTGYMIYCMHMVSNVQQARKFNFSLNSGFPACADAAYVGLPAFSHVVFTCWIKSSDGKRSVLLLPKCKTSPNLG